MKILILFLLAFFVTSCRIWHPPDPNANTIVVSRYLDEDPKIILPAGAPCKQQVDCTGKTKGECSVALYNDAVEIMDKATALEDKKLFLSAKLEYMIAVCRLSAAEILYKQALTEKFQDFQIIQTFKLKEKIKLKLKKCDSKILSLGWKQL